MPLREYDINKQHAEEASERANHHDTVSMHRKAAVAHLLAMGHAEMIGEKEQAREHDRRADEHLDKMKALAEYQPTLNKNLTIE